MSQHGWIPNQVPTASRIVNTTKDNALSSGQTPYSAGYAGWIRVVTKIVTDQNGTDIVMGNQSLKETVTVQTPNALNIGGVVTGNATTNAQGLFTDTLFVCSGVCPQSTGTATAQQTITDTYQGVAYTLTPNTLTYSCTGNKINGQ